MAGWRCAARVAVGLLVAGAAHGATAADGFECLLRNDVPCAEAVVAELDAASSEDATRLRLAAETAFYAGRYTEAEELMGRAVARGYADPWGELALYQRTRDATEGWTEVTRGRFQIRYLPGVDAILVDDAAEALVGADRHLAGLLGEAPPGRTILEIYPDGRRFIAASSLTRQDVETTGIVAISKWSRLLITSPRALGRGYSWQTTIAHEYIHLLVSYHTDDRAPVWLQEAIARYLDNRWSDGTDGFKLSVGQQGLLAEALATDALVSFDDMHPSLAKLPSAELASLAYAQVSSLMDFCFREGGEDVLQDVLPAVRDGEDPRVALAAAAGRDSFAELEADWLAWVSELDLVGRRLQSMPTVVDGGDLMALDPVLSKRVDMQRWVRLGDLLRERGRPSAALVEYAKALDPDEPDSPLLANRVAQAHLELGDLASAAAALTGSLRDYPEFALSHKTMGEILRRQGRPVQALEAYREAVALNPFDPEVQTALQELYLERGDQQRAALHARHLRILRRGGEG